MYRPFTPAAGTFRHGAVVYNSISNHSFCIVWDGSQSRYVVPYADPERLADDPMWTPDVVHEGSRFAPRGMHAALQWADDHEGDTDSLDRPPHVRYTTVAEDTATPVDVRRANDSAWAMTRADVRGSTLSVYDEETPVMLDAVESGVPMASPNPDDNVFGGTVF